MRAARSAILIAAAMQCAVADDGSQVPHALQQRIDSLIAQLASEQLAERRSAEEELVRLGPQALPLLPPPDLLDRASVREAVRRVRVTLEREQALASTRAARVTLRGEHSLADALAAITRQTENRIEVSAVPARTLARPLRWEFDAEPFWSALDDLRLRAGLEFAESKQQRAVALAPRTEEGLTDRQSVAYSGPFRIAVESARLRRLPGEERYGQLRVQLRLRHEPRLRPLFLKSRGRELRAVATDSTELPPFSPEASLELPVTDGSAGMSLQADFTLPESSLPRQIDLRGRFDVLLAAGEEEIVLGGLDRGDTVSRRRGGVTVTLNEVQLERRDDAASDVQVDVTVSYDTGGPAFETHRTWVFHNEVRLESPSGERIGPEAGFETKRQASGGVRVVYRFRGVKGAASLWRFVYVAPTLITNVSAGFELTQVPVAADNDDTASQ